MPKEKKESLGNLREKTKYEKPEDVEELEKELKERGRLMVGWISKLVTSRMEDIEGGSKETKSSASSKEKEDERWSEQRTERTIAELQDRISVLKDIERVVDPYIKKERNSEEKIEIYKKETLKLVEEISKKEKEGSGIKELVEAFSEERLNQLKWFELEKLPPILEKVKNGELLTEKEAGFLRYCAYFRFEETNEEESKKSEEQEESQKTKATSEEQEEGPKPPEPPKSPEPEPKTPEPPQPTPEPKPKSPEPPEPPKPPEPFPVPPSPEPTSKPPSPEPPEPTPEPSESPEPSPSIEDIEKRVLSLEEAENNLNRAREEYLRQYRERITLRFQINRERDENVKLQLQSRLRESELILNNAKRLYDRALEEYKIALYFDLLRRKKEYLFNRIRDQKEDIIIARIKKENPEISENELNVIVNEQVQKEVEEIFVSEKQEIQKEVIGIIAYNVLQRQEQLAQEEQNILRQENERCAGFFGRLWNRYKGLSYGRKALIGAGIAGLLGGGFAAAGGAGFAALGIGSAFFARRFFGGFVVGGGIKGTADRLISRKERRTLDKETAQKIDQISQEISSLINNPEKAPKNYENWLKLANHLDTRLNDVLAERNRIREESDKRRRRWTLIAALIGGLTANADNLYNFVTGHSAVSGVEGGVPSGKGAGVGGTTTGAVKEFVPPSPKPPENFILTEPQPEITPDMASGVPSLSPEMQKVLDAISQQTKAGGFPVPVGRGGFWEAAKALQHHLNISDTDFGSAWSKAVVTDPISGKVFNLPDAHWVYSADPKNFASLVYNPTKNVFEAIVAPKVQIGDAEKLLEAYYRLDKPVPLAVLKSIGKLP